MERRLAERDRLNRAVAELLTLFAREPALQAKQERLLNEIRATLHRITDDRPEVAIVGPSGAGKSTLIKALLGREIFYSGREDFVTGTECRLLWAADAARERAILTYASLGEIVEKLELLCASLGLDEQLHAIKSDQFQSLGNLIAAAEAVQRTEGGSDRQQSRRSKLATALIFLARGLTAHYRKLQTRDRYQETVADFKQAAEAIRFGSHSAVLQQVECYCHNPLLRQATLVDFPGWDAPLAHDAQLTLEKIRDPDVAAIICVLPVTAAGDIAPTDSEFIDILQVLPEADRRVFWACNFCDRTWSDERARQTQRALKTRIAGERSYDTCGILGYYGPILAAEITDERGRSGIDALNAASLNPQETQLFKNVFLEYYRTLYGQRNNIEPVALSGELDADFLRVAGTAGSGQAVLEAATVASSLPQLKHALASFLTQERRDRLAETLATEIQTLGLCLVESFVDRAREISAQPEDLVALQNKLLGTELATLRHSLQEVLRGWAGHLRASGENLFPADLQATATDRLRDALQTFVQELPLPTPPSTDCACNVTRSQLVPLAPSLDAIADLLEKTATAILQTALQVCRDRFLAEIPQQPYHAWSQCLAGIEPLKNCWQEAMAAAEGALAVAIAIECDCYRQEGPALQAALTAADLDALAGGNPLPAAREGALRAALTEDALARAESLGAYLQRALQLTLQRSLQALTTESKQFQLYDSLSDICRAQLDREIAIKARDRQLENHRLKRELAQKVDRYHQLNRDIGTALQALGFWDFSAPEVPAGELSWRVEEVQWPTE